MKPKQIITMFGIVILLVSISLGAYFAYSNGLLTVKSDPTIQPTKIKVTNTNHDRFTISWITEQPTNGSIIYGTSPKLDQIQIDDTDQLSGQQSPRTIHHITLTNLNPDTVYQFKIRSGEKNTIFDDGGKPFSTKTAAVLSAQPAADLINGVVTLADGKPATDAVVYVSIPGSSPLSTQVKKDGTWLLNLAVSRSSDLSSYTQYDLEKDEYEVLIQGDKLTSKVAIATSNDSPVPPVVLGETYDFTKALAQSTPVPTPEATPTSSSSAQLASQFPVDKEKTASKSARTPEQNLSEGDDPNAVDFLNPFEEYEELTTAKPEFRGTGPKGTVLTLSIEGPQNISTSTTIGSDGIWKFTPTKALTQGNYVLGVSYVDTNNDTITMERNFIIGDAAGTGGTTPAYTATTSGTKATPKPTVKPTVAPRRSMPSTASGTPQSGFELPTIMMLLFGLGLGLTGIGWKKRLVN